MTLPAVAGGSVTLIAGGFDYGGGDVTEAAARPAMLADVAAAAGVGIATASRALNESGYVSTATKERVREAARQLGYRPNAVAKALRSARTGVIGLLLPDLRNEYYSVSSNAIQRELAGLGLRLMVAAATTAAEERDALASFVAQQVDGIIHVPVDPAGELPDIPIVQVNRTSHPGEVPAVVCDEEEGLRELTALVLGGGPRHVALFVGGEEHSTTRSRISGFRQALEGSAVASTVLTGEFSAEFGAEAAARALAGGADALIAASPRIAVGVVQTLQRDGVRVPADCQLASYSDPEWFSLWQPGMTTLVPPLEEMGRLAVRRLRAILAGEEGGAELTVLPGEVIRRGSTR
nr:LacI family transcriptional regulator [Actinomycetales bacterium]